MNNRKNIIVVGPGGVGKTTLSFLLGVVFFEAGKKVVVVSIDPSRRLADIFGLKLTQKLLLHELSPQLLYNLTNRKESKGSISVALLYPELLLERLLSPYLKDTEKKLNENSLFPYILTIPGINEYMAYELIYHIMKKIDYEIMIIDTPPLNNSINIFTAPKLIKEALHSPFFNMFLTTYKLYGKSIKDEYLKGKIRFFWKYANQILGENLVTNLIEIVIALLGGAYELSSHIEKVITTFSLEDTKHLIIVTPEKEPVEEIRKLRTLIKKDNFFIIINRVAKKLPKLKRKCKKVLSSNKEIKKVIEAQIMREMFQEKMIEDIKKNFTNKQNLAPFILEEIDNEEELIQSSYQKLKEWELLKHFI